jgi:ubiquinone/menaquinone biosynthesis C-methylase UbiE
MQNDHLYAEKDSTYYASVRQDVVDLIPETSKRLLDVGCASGDTGAAAKRRLGPQCEVVGIEFYEPAALAARNRLDRVIIGDIEQLTLDFPDNYFDCVLCADVLEHTKNPWDVLNTLRRFLANDGVLIASLPNLRHVVPILKIIFTRFEYDESGILDKTHLRFFTLHTIRQMFHQTGYEIERITANRSVSWKFTLLNLFSFGLMRQFSIYQYVLLARKK